jgi:hypothetical protein
LFEKTIETEEQIGEEDSVVFQDDWKMIQCSGCDSISMLKETWCSAVYDEHGRHLKETSYFPPRIFKHPPKWIKDDLFCESLPRELERLLSELYTTLQNNCIAAATMLIRSIMETVIIGKCGDHGSFQKNLDEFTKEGYVGVKQKELLSSLLDVGHAVTHRNYIPPKADVIDLVETLENVITTIYHQIPKLRKISSQVPSRKKALRAAPSE